MATKRWSRRPRRQLPLLDGKPSLVRDMVRRAVDRAGTGGMTVAGICAAIGLSVDAAKQHLADLERHGFVIRRGQMIRGQVEAVFVSALAASAPPAS